MRIVTLNLWGRSGPWRARHRLAAHQLAALRPDVVCLQEVDDTDALRRLARETSLDVAVADPDGSALAILTRRRRGLERSAVEAAELLVLQAHSPFESAPRSLCAVHLAGVTIANTHLSWRADDGDTRRRQAEQVSRHLPAPAIVCGDFNCELEAPEMAPLTARFVDVLAGTPAAARPTWDNRNPHTAPYRADYADMRIDLILADPGVLARHERRETAVVLDAPDRDGLYASDHFGVLVDLHS